jgi:VanZ family protein
MHPDRLQGPLRGAIFAAAAAVVLYLSLAPSDGLPSVSLWDKAQHALAWGALTGLGLALAPRRWRAVAGFTLLLGVAVEILQATMGFGRMGDWRDLVADAVGILAAIRLTQAIQRLRRRPAPVGDSPDPSS